LPTIPTSPPAIPTPFPQPFDGIITQNFTSSSCLNFFNNMTASTNFRQCRPFSFLFSTSSTFINAQTNLTLMNSLIWGTCNTTQSYDQCQSNMALFASQLQSDCSQELGNQNLN
jgi:ABC-type polysaccharide/polyol phosphate export permease